MPIWVSYFRCIRRRVILVIICLLLFMYGIFNLLRNEKKGLSIENDFDDMDNMNIGESNDIFLDEDGLDEVVKPSDRPLLWQMEVMNDNGNVNIAEIPHTNTLSFNNNDTSLNLCRNSVQGKSLIVDEKGYVCTRYNVLANGCCNAEQSQKPTSVSTLVPLEEKSRYSCKTCNPQGCCEIYEYCVSCCLDPNKIKKKKNVILEQKLKQGDSLKLRLRSLDRFSLCLALCRTSSASVKHENEYRNPNFKHCYLLQLPNGQRHKRNSVINNNNNDNDLMVAFTSSSAVDFINLLVLYLDYPIPNKSIYQKFTEDRMPLTREDLSFQMSA